MRYGGKGYELTGVAGRWSSGRNVEAERTVLTICNPTANAGIGLGAVGGKIHQNGKSEQVGRIHREGDDY